MKRKCGYLLFGALSLIGALIVAALFWSAYRDDIGIDSSILLLEMERIADGYIPYSTMHLNYPPLWYYMMLVLKDIFNIPYGCFDFYLSVNFLFLLLCGFLVYEISLWYCPKKWVAAFSAWLFVVCSFISGARNVMFEVPSVMFGLAGLFSIGKCKDKHPTHFLWIGCLFAAAFLVKQFGLGFAGLGLFMLLFSDCREKWKKILFCATGFLVFVGIFVALFGLQFLNSILFNGYSTHSGIGHSGRIHNLIKACSAFVKKMPVVVIAFFLLPAFIQQRKFLSVLLLFLGIAGFSLQFLFLSQASHYYIYMMPFAVLLVPAIAGLELSASEKLITIASLAATLYLPAEYNTTKVRIQTNARSVQRHDADRLRTLIDSESTFWIANTAKVPLYYLLNLKTPNMAEAGYCVSSLEISPEKAKMQAADCDFIICTQTYSTHWTDNFITEDEHSAILSGKITEFDYLFDRLCVCGSVELAN